MCTEYLVFLRRYLFVFVVALVSCGQPDIEEPELRAVNRWNAMIEGDWGKAYSFETPAYRKVYSLKQYMNTYGAAVNWKSIRFVSASVLEGGASEVVLELTSAYESYEFADEISERWLFEEGQWWHVKK